jgi:hypothetical protein
MGHERWFRGQRDGQDRPFDWLTPARQHGIPEKRARALYEQAVSQAQAHRAAPGREQELYLALLAEARQEAWRPAPGKVTRTMRLEAERTGTRGRFARGTRLGRQALAPGKSTLTSYLAPREHEPRSPEPAGEARDQRAHIDLMADVFRRFGMPAPATLENAWSEAAPDDALTGADARGLDALPWGDEHEHVAEPLPEATRGRMERAFGRDFDDVVVYPDSPEATGATRALTRGREIHFRAGAFAPGTAEGDRLIAHELAHVVQQSAGPGQSAGRRALESEADRAASALLAGQRVSVSLGASMSAALAFSDSEDHDTEEPAPRAEDAATPAAAAPATEAPAIEAPAAEAPATEAPAIEAPAAELSEADDAALLAEIRAPIPAEPLPGGPGGGGGGGAAAEEIDAEAPEVSGAPPEQGLAALQGVRPDKLAGALDGVRTAASTEVSGERDELAQDPPEQMSTGEDVSEPAPGAELAAAGEAAEPGQTGDVAAAGQDQQAALEQPAATADTTALTEPPPLPVDAALTPVVENAPAGEGSTGGGMSDEDIDRMSDSLDALPTSDPYASTEPGPAPELAVTDEADASAEAKRVALDTTVTGAEDAAAIDIAQPMGEDHIETTLVPETLSADLDAAAAAAGSAVAEAGAELGGLQAQALGDADENAGIIAHLEKRAEIDAALAEAQAEVAAEREAHLRRQEDERVRVDEEIAALQTQAEADQAQAREDARAQVDQARADWQVEVDAAAATARAEAETEITDGMSEIEAEQVRANTDAQAHIDQGRIDAEAEQQAGEDEAERIKDEKEEESGGFFGWLASQAEAFFEGVKQAISDALEAARQAIQAVIDEAKRLAVEVIEAARQVIVDTIKAVGDALIAIGDRLLAAFPELREQFRDTIQGFVDDAVEAVNEFAEQLKEDVQNALDALGQALDAALNLLEQGLHAIVDGVSAAVQEAISFAEGVVDMVGVFAVLIQDIAADPGGWLGMLGAAAMDGVQNHLWGALTTAVLDWFQGKVLDLLGIGGIILQLLMDGGIDLAQISSMAWEALQNALPAALIGILIEKVVAMIIPAVGAVMAIIEGLQAAWDTVSSILSAFGAFVAFLQAVKSGAAGPMFANLLAMAAVVVIDFVSNWLLAKLAAAARRIGAKLRQLAERFQRRRQGRRDDDTPDRDRDRRDRDGDEDEEDAGDLRTEAQRAARRGWDDARARSSQRVVRESEIEQVLRSNERHRGGIRVELELVEAGDQWKVRATAREGAERATAEAGHGWIARDGSQTWYAAVDQQSKHDRIAEEADRRLDQEASELAATHTTLRELHIALRPRIRHIEQVLTERLLEGIRFDINEAEYSEGRDLQGDEALLYSWEIRPNTSKNRLAASGGKKRGDHLFNHGLGKLQAKLSEQLGGVMLDRSQASVDAALSVLGSSFTHAAFKVVVQKPVAAGSEGDANSQVFGRANQSFVDAFQDFLSALERTEFADPTELEESLAELNGALQSVTASWNALLDAAHDSECGPHLSREDKALEQQGLALLAAARGGFPLALAGIIALFRNP